MDTKHYAEREIDELDFAGDYYTNHVMAMTAEGLNSKSAIAGELAFRDFTIDQMADHITRLEIKIDELLRNNDELGEDIHELTEERDSLSLELTNTKAVLEEATEHCEELQERLDKNY